ncbi:MAG TPA: amino acid permease [Nitrososphaerales archaeon]|nr:amino acid permease [Nitrososphaerales archaeon]
MTESKVFVRNATGLVRAISPFGAFAIGIVGVAISVSVYVNESLIPALFPRSNVSLLFAFALPIVFCWALMYMQFNVAMPRSGADYVWVSRTLNPVIGFLQNFYTFFAQTTVIGVIAAVVLLMLVNAFEAAGLAFKSSSIFNISTTISTPVNITILGTILVLIFAVITASGIRNLQRVVVVLWAYSIIGLIGFIILLLSVSHAAFVNNFNSAFGTNEVAKILQTAGQKGYATGWTIGGTFAALPFAIEAVLGFAWATYAGGEMKNIRRSSLMASVVPAMFVSVLFIVFGYAVYNTFGYDFSSAIGYLYNNFPGAVAAGTGAASAPVALPFVYSVFMNSNPYLVTFIAFSFPIGQAASILTSFLLVTRCLFAYSFDRVVPAKFSEVSERFIRQFIP